jgi:hypothetical protein
MNDGSRVFGISVRAFLTMLLTFCVCFMSGFGMKIEEPMYSSFLLSIGFYFGQKSIGGTNAK